MKDEDGDDDPHTTIYSNQLQHHLGVVLMTTTTTKTVCDMVDAEELCWGNFKLNLSQSNPPMYLSPCGGSGWRVFAVVVPAVHVVALEWNEGWNDSGPGEIFIVATVGCGVGYWMTILIAGTGVQWLDYTYVEM